MVALAINYLNCWIVCRIKNFNEILPLVMILNTQYLVLPILYCRLLLYKAVPLVYCYLETSIALHTLNN